MATVLEIADYHLKQNYFDAFYNNDRNAAKNATFAFAQNVLSDQKPITLFTNTSNESETYVFGILNSIPQCLQQQCIDLNVGIVDILHENGCEIHPETASNISNLFLAGLNHLCAVTSSELSDKFYPTSRRGKPTRRSEVQTFKDLTNPILLQVASRTAYDILSMPGSYVNFIMGIIAAVRVRDFCRSINTNMLRARNAELESRVTRNPSFQIVEGYVNYVINTLGKITE